MSHYRTLKDGGDFTVRAGEKFRLSCCDCGLVHDFLMVASPKGKVIGVAVERNERATSARRRGMQKRGEIKVLVQD